jgi:hypothetical protein
VPQGEPEVLALSGWVKGLNKAAHPSLVGPDELSVATNVILGPRGEVRLRPGMDPYSVYTDADSYLFIKYWGAGDELRGAEIGGEPLTEAFFATKTADSKTYVVAAFFDGTAQRTEFEIGAFHLKYLLELGDAVYVGPSNVVWEVTVNGGTDEVEAVQIDAWSVSGDGDVNDKFITSNTSANSDVIPIIAYERVFGIHSTGVAVTVSPHRLWFSEPLLPKSWKTTNFIDISPETDRSITYLIQFADQLIIFKDHSVWGISGRDFATGSDLQVYQIDGAIGTTTPRTGVVHGGVLFFLDLSQGVFAFDGSVFHNIGESIFDYLQSGIMEAFAAPFCHAWIADEKYHLVVPWAPPDPPTISAFRTFVFDLRLQAWTEWDRGWSGVATGNGGQAAVIGVHFEPTTHGFNGFNEITEEAFDDDGEAIDYEVSTGWLAPSGGLLLHRIRQFIADLGTTATTTTLELHTAYDTSAATATVTLDPAAGQEDGILLRTHALNMTRWRTARFVLSGSSDGAPAPFQVNGLRVVYTSLPGLRGANV